MRAWFQTLRVNARGTDSQERTYMPPQTRAQSGRNQCLPVEP